MNYSDNDTSLRLDQLRRSVESLGSARQEASSLKIAREGLVSNFLSSVFARASVALQDFVSAVCPKVSEATLSSFDQAKNENLESADFLKLRKLNVSTMEGFVGKYLPYGKYVLTTLSYYDTDLNVQLKDFRLLLGGIINNHEDRKALLSLEGKYKASKANIESIDRDGASFWQRGSYRAIQPAGEVIERVSDITEINKDARAIGDKLKQVNFEQVQARVAEVRELIKVALQSIDSGSLKEVSDAQLNNLSKGVLGLAESVEFFGLVLYRANVYLSAVERLNTAIKKAF